jgi:2-iminobutanoate/2-iminopropanoate deaminase
MPRRQAIQPPGMYRPERDGRKLYSQVLAVEGRRLVFLAGQIARDADGRLVGAGDMRAQIRQTCENIKAALEAAGATLADVVKTTTYVTDIDEFRKHLDVRTGYFQDGLPTSTTVEVSRLVYPGYMVEIEVMAVTD